jgi:hypothetical protein
VWAGSSTTPLQEITPKSGNEANAEIELAEILMGEGSCENYGQITTNTCPKCSVCIHEFCACPW